jgi:hypothetical protein
MSRPCAHVATGLLIILAPLVLRSGLLGLATLHGCVVHAFPFLAIENAPTASSREAKQVDMSNSSLESTGGLRPSLCMRSRQVVPLRACTISD